MPCCRSCRIVFWTIACLAALAWLLRGAPVLLAADDAADLLPVAEIKHPKPVDFQREILPILKKNCLACHNATDAEGKLVLETPQTIAKGGENGPAVVARQPDKSLLLERVRGGGDGIMPPEDNKVAASPLKPDELGLLKLWIAQGATGTVRAEQESIKWQPLPPGVNPIFAVALSADGQFAACGRANQIFIYQVPTGRVIGRLTDPAILKSGIYTQPGVADLDLIQSLAFNPDASLLASGGYRTIKLWRRTSGEQMLDIDKLAAESPLAVSADGKVAAVADVNATIRLFDPATGRTIKSLAGHSDRVTSLEFDSAGKLLCSGSADRSVRLWSVAEGKFLGRIDLAGPVVAAVLVDSGKQVAAAITGDSKIVVNVWPSGKPGASATGAAKKAPPARSFSGHSKPVTALAAFPKNPNQLVSASADGKAMIWEVGSGKKLREFNHRGAVAAVAVRADGERIATAGADKVVRLWNGRDGKQLAELRGDLHAIARADEAARTLTLAKNGVTEAKNDVTDAEKAVTAEADNVKKATEALAAAEKALPAKVADQQKQAVAKQAADKVAAADTAAKTKAADALAAADKQAAAADTAQKAASQALTTAKDRAKKSPKDKAATDALAKAEAAAKAAAATLKSAKDAQTAAKQQLVKAEAALKQSTAKADAAAKTLETADEQRKNAETAKLSASKALASATSAAEKSKQRVPTAKTELAAAEKRLASAEAALKQAQAAATATESPYQAVAFSSDGLELATGNAAGLVHTWSSETGTALNAFACRAPVRGVAYDRAELLATAGGRAMGWNTLPVWQWYQTLGAGSDLPVDRVTALDFSPDGKLLASGGGAPSRSGELKLWNVASGRLVRNLPDAHSDTVLGVRFSPDGRLLGSCGTDKFLKVFDVDSGKLVRAFEGHTHHVLGTSWQSDGKLLATAGADNTIKIWDLASGEQQRTIQGFSKEVTSVNFLADTPNVLATSGDKSIRIVRANDGQTVRTLSGASDFEYASAASADGRTIIAGGQDSVLRAFKGVDGQLIRNFDPPPPPATPAK